MPERSHRTGTILALDAIENSQSHAFSEPQVRDSAKIKQEIFLRLIAEHDGRSFASAGKHAIAEFTNAVEAVRCAVDIQLAMLGENKRLPLEHRVLLRIGLHVGDVREENGALHGDGVDTAVGLEELAVPGGIC